MERKPSMRPLYRLPDIDEHVDLMSGVEADLWGCMLRAKRRELGLCDDCGAAEGEAHTCKRPGKFGSIIGDEGRF